MNPSSKASAEGAEMTIEPHPDLDGSMSRRFGTVADEAG